MLQLLELTRSNLTAWVCAIGTRCVAYAGQNNRNCGDTLRATRTAFQVSTMHAADLIQSNHAI